MIFEDRHSVRELLEANGLPPRAWDKSSMVILGPCTLSCPLSMSIRFQNVNTKIFWIVDIHFLNKTIRIQPSKDNVLETDCDTSWRKLRLPKRELRSAENRRDRRLSSKKG